MFQSRNKMLFSTVSKSALSRTSTETSPLSEAMRRSLATYQYILPVVPGQRHEAQKYRSTVHDTTMLDNIQGAGCARTTAMRQSTLGNMQLPLTPCVQLFFNPFLSIVPPPRDSTIAVAIGASVGGALALLILSMVIIKCLRRHRKQELISEEKMEEEGKLEAEGVAEEGTK